MERKYLWSMFAYIFHEFNVAISIRINLSTAWLNGDRVLLWMVLWMEIGFNSIVMKIWKTFSFLFLRSFLLPSRQRRLNVLTLQWRCWNSWMWAFLLASPPSLRRGTFRLGTYIHFTIQFLIRKYFTIENHLILYNCNL